MQASGHPSSRRKSEATKGCTACCRSKESRFSTCRASRPVRSLDDARRPRRRRAARRSAGRRQDGARWPSSARGADAEKVAAYNMLARNKRSIVLNLREQEAREIFYKLADDSRRRARGLPARRREAPRRRLRHADRAQPAHRLLLALRLRADGAVQPARRPRHQLHLGRRRARA